MKKTQRIGDKIGSTTHHYSPVHFTRVVDPHLESMGIMHGFVTLGTYDMKHPIARYLMCAYAYYIEDDPLIDDSEFDDLSKYILHYYDRLEHMHKHLLTKDDLRAGTYLGKYPLLVSTSVDHYRKHGTKKAMNWQIEASLDEFF